MSFAGFPQQQQVVQLLQRSLERGRLSHAYLFAGGDLGELESVARTLAKTLNCQNPVLRPGAAFQSDCCDQCLSCRKIDGGGHPDVQWVRPESKSRIITIDQIRELMHIVGLKPTEAQWKAAVIVGADRLNVQAANAFLKTLEEPPPRSVLLLLSTDPERILETVLSRCLRLAFAGESGPHLDSAHEAWLTQFAQMAKEPKQGLLSRYRLLGALLAKLNGIKSEAEKALSARSPLEQHDDIEPRLRDKWEAELAAAVEADTGGGGANSWLRCSGGSGTFGSRRCPSDPSCSAFRAWPKRHKPSGPGSPLAKPSRTSRWLSRLNGCSGPMSRRRWPWRSDS